MSTPQPSIAPAPRPTFSLVRVLLVALPLVVGIAGGTLAYFHYTTVAAPADLSNRVLRHVAGATRLADDFVDKDDDLVADPPATPLETKKLVFSILESEPELWNGFRAHLEKAVKMPVEIAIDIGARELPDKLRAGEVHIATASTGMVPTMVNAGGFVPAFCMGNDKGEFAYKVKILARADGPIHKIADLKGRSITLTSVGSLSSFKVPVQVLDDHGLRFGKDYEILYAAGQRASIEQLAQNKCEAIAVASDFFQRIVKAKKLNEAAFRTLYESSESYPPACFGYHHALKKETADAIRHAFETYPWDDAFRKEFGAAEYTRFVPITYKTAWEQVRKIDEKINRFLDGK